MPPTRRSQRVYALMSLSMESADGGFRNFTVYVSYASEEDLEEDGDDGYHTAMDEIAQWLRTQDPSLKNWGVLEPVELDDMVEKKDIPEGEHIVML